MKLTHIKAEKVIEEDFKNIKIKNLFSYSNYSKVSVAQIRLIGEQKDGYNIDSDLIYYVLDGRGSFFVENRELVVKKGDLVFIPKNTIYRDSGDLTLLAIATPKFEKEKRKEVNKQ